MTLVFRRMRRNEDARQFQRNVNALVAENARILEDKPQTLKQEKTWLHQLWKDILQGKAKAWVVEDRGDVVALSFAKKGTGRESGNVELSIGVNKTHRSKGLGKTLLEKCIQDARKWRAKTIWLSVLEGNAPAIRLYRKTGFKTVARLSNWAQVNHKREDKLIMVLSK